MTDPGNNPGLRNCQMSILIIEDPTGIMAGSNPAQSDRFYPVFKRRKILAPGTGFLCGKRDRVPVDPDHLTGIRPGPPPGIDHDRIDPALYEVRHRIDKAGLGRIENMTPAGIVSPYREQMSGLVPDPKPAGVFTGT